MRYVEQNLMNNEKIIYTAKIHKFIFVIPGLCALFFFLVGIKTPLLGVNTPLLEAGWFALSLLFIVVPFINYKTSEFAVTNKRVILKVGFIARTSVEILLLKVEGVQVSQDILGRIFDFGTIRITGTGGTSEPFNNIAMPFQFRRSIQEQIDQIQTAQSRSV